MMRRRQVAPALCAGLMLGWMGSARAAAFDSFFSAVRRDDAATVTYWLRRGFDPNTVDEQFTPALVLAMREDSVEAAAALLQQAGLKLEATNMADETALMLACLRGHVGVVRLLLARGAVVNRPGWAALHYAASRGDGAIVRLLLEAHAYIDAESPNGSTPLMMAAQYGTPEAVKLLLEEGADVTLKNQLGVDALGFAQRGSRPDSETIIRAFLAAVPRK